MVLENVKAYTTSKNDVEVILNGKYEVTEKVLNGRRKLIDTTGKFFWVDARVTFDSTTKTDSEKFFEQVKDLPKLDANKSAEFFTRVKQRGADNLEAVVSIQSTQNADIKEQRPSNPVYHIVKRGETIQSVALLHGTTASSIVALNGTPYLTIGKRIRVK